MHMESPFSCWPDVKTSETNSLLLYHKGFLRVWLRLLCFEAPMSGDGTLQNPQRPDESSSDFQQSKKSKLNRKTVVNFSSELFRVISNLRIKSVRHGVTICRSVCSAFVAAQVSVKPLSPHRILASLFYWGRRISFRPVLAYNIISLKQAT